MKLKTKIENVSKPLKMHVPTKDLLKILGAQKASSHNRHRVKSYLVAFNVRFSDIPNRGEQLVTIYR